MKTLDDLINMDKAFLLQRILAVYLVPTPKLSA